MDYKPKNREWVKNAAIIFLAVLLVLTFFSQTIMNRTLPEVATQQVTEGSITAKVRGTGKVTAEGRYDVKADRTREIRAVMVKVGQEVKVGDVLFVLGEGSGDELETAQEKLQTLETSYARAAAGISYPNYKYDEDRIKNAETAYNEAEAIWKQFTSSQGNKNIDELTEKQDAERARLSGLIETRDEEQAKYDAAVAAAESALTVAVSDRDMAQRQLMLDGITIVDPSVENWGFLYKELPIQFDTYEYSATGEKLWAFDIDPYGLDKRVVVDEYGNVDTTRSEALSATLSEGTRTYAVAPLVYTVRPGDNAQPLFASLFGPGMGVTLLAADPVGDLELAGLLDGFTGSGDSSEAQDPSLEVQTPATGSAEPGAGSEAGLTEPASEGTDQPATPSAPGTEPGGQEPAAGTDTDPGTGTTTDPGAAADPATNPAADGDTGESGTGDEDSEAEPIEIPRHIYAQIILYCKAEIGIVDAKAALENVPKTDLNAAQKDVDDCQGMIDGYQADIDRIMETLPTSSAGITAKANRDAAYATLISLREALENKQQADAQTQAMGYIDLQDLAAQIERQKEKIAELSGGEDNQILAKVNGTVQSLGCVAGDTKVKDDVLCSIEVPDRGYYLEFSVTNEQARRLRVGDSASVSNYYWGNQVEATLRSITVDPKNPQTNKILTFDLSGDVTSGADLTISVGSKSATYDNIVPNSAIRSDTNGTFVFAVEAKSSPLGNRYIARRVAVEVLAADDNNSAVTGSFGYGSYVITTSNAPIKNGDLVRLADNG